MKESIKKNKKLIIIGIAIILILLIGVAFVYLTTTLYGTKEYAIRAGSLGLKLEEGNELVLEKVIPLEDSEGQSLNGFNFSLVNEGGIDTDYTIYLDDMELNSGETRMPDSAIRYSLTKDNVVGNANDLSSMGVTPNRAVDTGTIEPDQTLTSRDIINSKMRSILDEATDPWGIKVNRVEVKNIIPPRDIQDAMEKQMRAERERREKILQAEGEKKAAVLIAEGEKESTVLRAEAAKEAAIKKAEGEAEAIIKIKNAEAEGIRLLKDAKADASVLKLKSYDAMVKVANGQSTKIIVPSELQSLVTAGTVLSETFKEGKK